MTRFPSRQDIAALIDIARVAGQTELALYGRDVDVAEKSDGSPVTLADRLAEESILAGLDRIAPDIPAIAEEAASRGRLPAVGERFFLVDPLDGTREFVNRSGEFTVNIALIEHGRPVFGLVYAPALGALYVTTEPGKAVFVHLPAEGPAPDVFSASVTRLMTRVPDAAALSVVASRSHMNDATRRFIDALALGELRPIGSSLKFCLIARGEADVYPRFGLTSEWDTAAGHAVLEAAGGAVTLPDGGPLTYGRQDALFRNPPFIAWGRPPHDRRS